MTWQSWSEYVREQDSKRRVDLAIRRRDIWIQQALRGLCAEAQSRLHSEFLAHYDDAFHSALARAETESCAHRAALASLGDERKINRTLKRTYLTAFEAERLQKAQNAYKNGQPWYAWMFLILAWCLWAGYVSFLSHARATPGWRWSETGVSLILALLVVISPAIGRAWCTPAKKTSRSVILGGDIAVGAAAVLAWSRQLFTGDLVDIPFPLEIVFLALSPLYLDFRLLRKLHPYQSPSVN